MNGSLRIIVAGGGELGLRTASLLADRGHDIVMVEEDRARGEELSDEYVGTVIQGNAARPAILRQARPGDSDVIAALTDDEATNFAICMATQRMADIRTVMRVQHEPDELYDEYVDGVVFPDSLGARSAANEIAGGGVRTLEEVGGNVEIVEVEVNEGAPAAGKSLQEISLPRGSLIIVDSAGNRLGGPETVLEAGERYLVAVESDVSDEVMNLLRG
jgi:trk system potassium uptake protein TrkA